jgi:hypothetical protein
MDIKTITAALAVLGSSFSLRATPNQTRKSRRG